MYQSKALKSFFMQFCSITQVFLLFMDFSCLIEIYDVQNLLVCCYSTRFIVLRISQVKILHALQKGILQFRIRGQVAFSIRALKKIKFSPKLTYLAFHLRKIYVLYARLASKIILQDLRNATRRAVYSNNKLSISNLIILFIVQTTIAKKILRKYLTICFGLFFKCMEID